MDTKQKVKILIVEDEMIIAADLSLQLTKLGYDIIAIHTKAETALETLTTNRPDIILMDVVLAGKMDGIQAATKILNTSQVPVIFLTSNTDDATFQRALKAKPFAFSAKPFRISELERTLKLALNRIQLEEESEEDNDANDHVSYMEDRLFIRHKNQMVKVNFSEIQFAEADRNYCKLNTDKQSFLLSIPLRSIEVQLPTDIFLRVHRSFVVNLLKIESVSDHLEFLKIGTHQIPISRRLKEDVAKRLKMI